MSLEVASSSSLSLTSNNTIPASTETTYTLTLTNNTSSTITDQRLLTFTFDYFDTLESGEQFNVDIKSLAGDSNPTKYTKNTSIKAIKVVNTLPNNVETIDVSEAKDESIKVYYDNGTIYLYTTLSKVILNKSSSHLFDNLIKVTEIDTKNFDTSNVTNMNDMFGGCSSLTSLDVSNFDTSNVTDMDSMFYGCSKLKTIYASNKFNTSQVSDSNYMFSYCTSLVGGNGTTYNSSYTDKTYARIDSSSTPRYFTSKA